ncbi:MAG: Mur ligase family protein, partial [Erysipelotrichaceae bacterium]|nr:Mur ligase family protein [Erysipelotrichaceae bacterium]
DINYLCKFVKPQIGLVTSIGPQHLQTFKNMDNIIKEKMQMIECLPKDGLGIINIDNEYIRSYQIKNSCKIVTYGIKNDATYRAVDIQYSPNGSTFNVLYENEKYAFSTKLLGEHNIMNILAAIAVARYLGVGWAELARSVRQVDYVEHRLQVKKINGYTFIDNAFNSNPEGAAMSLQVMSMMPNKRFIITPGLIDLGPQQYAMNHEFGRQMLGKVDVVILVGPTQTLPIYKGLEESNFKMADVYVVDTVKEAFNKVYALASKEDIILLENDLPDAFSK